MDKIEMSKVVQGFWRLDSWQYSREELNHYLHKLVDLGITTMDHADIYGDYTCERIFGEALNKTPELRKKMQIVTKCGIVLNSKTRPEYNFHKYDYSRKHIHQSVKNSLTNLNIEEIDVLLLHRPSPLLDAQEVALSLKELHSQGLVRQFGVSNFKAHQFDVLCQAMQQVGLTLDYNQLEISPMCLENIEDGTLNHMQKEKVKMMAWSPLAGGNIFKSGVVHNQLTEIAAQYDTTIDDISYRFINRLPQQIHTIVGSKDIDRVKLALKATELPLTDDEWFKIYTAALGRDIL